MGLRAPSLARRLSRTSTPRSNTALVTRRSLTFSSGRDALSFNQLRTAEAVAKHARNLTAKPVYTPSGPHTRRTVSTTTKASTEDPSTLAGAPDTTNHYTIFPQTLPAGPPPHSPFEISVADLRREFLQLQGAVHPDKYPSGTDKQRAEALSSRINEAYRTLSDPLQRAQYLLREWHGIDVTAEDGSAKHALDAGTLMEVMEVQETIEEVGASADAEVQIEALKDENEERIAGCVKALAAAFDRGDVEGARAECVKLRFWYSVGEGLREWEPGNTEIRLMHGE
ncbi:hypothetical protein N7539_008157 [Penicillium diatomitis]|uniref:J domain-containing protein n=1 Tax=Penicillium diatomitis TaxID=2819901 RepID=A0A9X0BMX0_9EURO|nr:uncharacterized protein N7539_008157 [Penicillium diatomitis]KAJ5475091.1 hypothetical protein N7539_008157 [Penicillium diatomitis]